MLKLSDMSNDPYTLSEYGRDVKFTSYGTLYGFISNKMSTVLSTLSRQHMSFGDCLTQRHGGMFSHYKYINGKIYYIDEISVSDFVKYYSDMSERVLSGYSLSNVVKYAIKG